MQLDSEAKHEADKYMASKDKKIGQCLDTGTPKMTECVQSATSFQALIANC